MGFGKTLKKAVKSVGKTVSRVAKEVKRVGGDGLSGVKTVVGSTIAGAAGLGGLVSKSRSTDSTMVEVPEVQVDPTVTNVSNENIGLETLMTKKRRKRGFQSTLSSAIQSSSLAGGDQTKTTLG